MFQGTGNKRISSQEQRMLFSIRRLLVWLLLFQAITMGALPGNLKAQETVYRVEIPWGTEFFHIPYRNLNLGDCFCLISRELERWSWDGKTEYRGALVDVKQGSFENIPLPADVSPGEYHFDILVGITYGEQICYSKPLPLVVAVSPGNSDENITICSGEWVKYVPQDFMASGSGAEKFRWRREAVSGIQEGENSGTGAINEILTNISSLPVEVIYRYEVLAEKQEDKKSFNVIVTVKPRLSVKVVNQTPELCSGEETNIQFFPGNIPFDWLAETLDVEGAVAGKGTEIKQQLRVEGGMGTVEYRILPLAESCMEEQSVKVQVNPLPEISLQQKNKNAVVSIGEALEFEAIPAIYSQYNFIWEQEHIEQVSPQILIYQWKEDEMQTVSVEVVAENGCKNVDSVSFRGPVLELTNVITPNGDGRNDLLFKGYQLKVFNRNGGCLYKGEEGWDGRYHGELVPTDTYLYVILYPTEDGKLIEYKYHVYVATGK